MFIEFINEIELLFLNIPYKYIQNIFTVAINCLKNSRNCVAMC